MAIQNDFIINPDTKVIRHDATKSTVYSAVAFYSYLQDVFDEPGFLSYEIPIRFNTPTSFTMLNGWFLDDGDGSDLLQYLTGGGIDTLNYATISDPVVMLDLDTQTVAWDPGDLDETVRADGSDWGPLLSFKESYPSAGLSRIWVRDTNSVGALVAGQAIDSYPGLGDYIAADYSQSGDNIYHNLFTIAAFPASPNPQLYVYQNHPVDGTRTRIAEWSAFTNWDRGTIDVLVTTQLAGTLIDGGGISTFVRQTADSFTFVESTLTTSGRTPIATETAADEVNITVGEHYMFYDGAGGDPGFTVGEIISDVPIGIIDTNVTPPGWYAEIVAHTSWDATTAGTGYLTLRGLRGTPVDADNIFTGDPDLADPVIIVDSVANVNGTVGDTFVTYDAGGASLGDPADIDKAVAADGGTASGAERILRAFQNDAGDVGKLCLQVAHTHGTFDSQDYTGLGRDQLYIQMLDNDVVTAPGAGTLSVTLDADSTTLISGFSDVTAAHMNGSATGGAIGVSTFIAGERVTWSGGEGVYIAGTASPLFFGNVQNPDTMSGNQMTGDISGATYTPDQQLQDDNTQNFEFSLQTTGALYSVFVEGGSIYNAGRSLTDIYAYLQFYLRDGQSLTARTIYVSDNTAITATAAEEYIQADMWTVPRVYNATKAAPYGTLAGGVFFGAQAVWLQGMAATDNNNIKLTDSTGTLREPFTTIVITVSNTRADDRIAIFLEDGATELPNKAQYTSAASPINAVDDQTFQRNTGAFPNDTPTGGAAGGTFIVVDNTLNKQHRYRYDTRNGTTNPGILNLPTELTGTTTAGSGSEVLIDTGAVNFPGVQVGDIIHRTNNSRGFAYVTSIANVGSNTLATTLIEDSDGVATTLWANTGDTYSIHSLVKTYTGADTFFIPYMDEISSDTNDVEVSLTFVAVREIILEVRNVEAITEIIPFKTTGQIGSGGYTQGVIRNEDTVIT